jgi:hypothetical protein
MIRRHIRPGMTFIDAGANMGDFTVQAARLVGSSGRVIAIEPAPGVALLQRIECRRNRGVLKNLAGDSQARLENGQGVVVCRADQGARPKQLVAGAPGTSRQFEEQLRRESEFKV